MSGRPTIGIALDSGGAMGGAHIGVLEVLKEHNIPLDVIVGSSAGAAVGAFYAAGSLEIFKGLISDLNFIEALRFYADPVFPVSGIFAGKRARKFLTTLLHETKIEDLPLSYVAVATDILTGETVPISEGLLADAVMASISMPGIFRPVILGDRILTDGGVSDPLPLDILKSFSPDITIACNLHSRLPDKLSSSQSKAIVTAQKKEGEADEDISSWVIDRVLAALPMERIAERIKGLRGMFRSTSGDTAVPVRENDLLNALKDQIDESKDRIGSLISKGFVKKNKADMLNIFEIMLSATNIQQYQKNRLMLMYITPDILIEPVIDQVRALEFNKGESTIIEGRKKAEAAIPAIKALIEEKSLLLGQVQGG